MQTSAIHFKRKSAAACTTKTCATRWMASKTNSYHIGRRPFVTIHKTPILRRCENAAVLFAMKASGRMPELLTQFEENARAAGSEVLWAANAESANNLIADIAARHNVRLAVKSKSMASEEVRLNDG